MIIDWFTVGAQTFNFIILVWLMKRFLYKPILHAIDERERRIAAELADADAKKAEAQKESDELRLKNETFEEERAALLSKATDEATMERQRLLDNARKAAEVLSLKQQETLSNEWRDMHHAIRARVQKDVFAIAGKALKDLATASLSERMVDMLTQRLKEMDDPTKSVLAQAFKTASEPALIRTAFDLPEEQRAVIQHALNETFSAEIQVRFQTEPDLISSIELTAHGQKVAWSISDYLMSLEQGVEELLKEKNKPFVNVEPEPETRST